MSKKKIGKQSLKQELDRRVQERNLILNFKYPFALRSTKYREFTNYYKNDDDLKHKLQILFTKIIPYVSEHEIQNLLNDANCHSHTLENDNKRLALDIIAKLVCEENGFNNSQAQRFIANNEFGDNLYQISTAASGGIRIIGKLVGKNEFDVLFIDPYHLLYPSEKYNNEDYKNFNTSLMEDSSHG